MSPDERLPQAGLAICPDEKITQYLLSEGHPAGRQKAAYFHRFGFSGAHPGGLKEALIAHAMSAWVIAKEATPYGIKYIVEGPLESPDRRNPVVRSVWHIAGAETAPRFVTAYPAPKGSRG